MYSARTKLRRAKHIPARHADGMKLSTRIWVATIKLIKMNKTKKLTMSIDPYVDAAYTSIIVDSVKNGTSWHSIDGKDQFKHAYTLGYLLGVDGIGVSPTGTEARVCEMIASRQRFGLNKYGVSVEANPLSLRQWAQHALEEALDFSIYLQRIIEELDRLEDDQK